MRTVALLSMAAAAAGCSHDNRPAWAIDPIWLEPTVDGVHGFQTWQLYRQKWEKKQDDKFYLCAVVVELTGTETACTDCQIAWDVVPTVLESDCLAAVVEDPTWIGLERVALGLPIDAADAPHPGFTDQGFADYGFGWEVHGQAWPDALDHGGSVDDATWDGEQAFTFWPTLVWPL